jgi:hypothetical protein
MTRSADGERKDTYELVHGKTNNGASACFVIYRSGEAERENRGKRVIYTQAQGSMNKCATRKVSRGENKREGKKCLGVLLATDLRGDVVVQISARIVRRSANCIKRRDGGHRVEDGAVTFDRRKLK